MWRQIPVTCAFQSSIDTFTFVVFGGLRKLLAIGGSFAEQYTLVFKPRSKLCPTFCFCNSSDSSFYARRAVACITTWEPASHYLFTIHWVSCVFFFQWIDLAKKPGSASPTGCTASHETQRSIVVRSLDNFFRSLLPIQFMRYATCGCWWASCFILAVKWQYQIPLFLPSWSSISWKLHLIVTL